MRALIAVAALYAASLGRASDDQAPVDIADDALRECVGAALGKAAEEPVSRSEMATLGYLQCASSDVANLSGLQYATELQSLDISRNQISDLAPIAGLSSLQSLYLGYNQVGDLTPLAPLTGLRQLGFGDNGVRDLAPLAGLTSLRWLSFFGNRVSDLAPLAGATGLSELYGGGNPVRDLGPLAQMTRLRKLGMQETEISDLTPLARLTALEWVFIVASRVSDVSALVANEGMAAGDVVFLEENPLSHQAITDDIPVLLDRGVDVRFNAPREVPPGAQAVQFRDERLEQLVRVRLRKGEGWPVVDRELAVLSGLSLAGLGIEDLTGLEFATGLRRLDLSNNRVADLDPLRGLSLSALWLSGNPVSDISPIAGMASLVSLTLDDTSIDDLAALAGMRNLEALALDGNPLHDLSALRGLTVSHLSLDGTDVSDLGALADLHSLEWLSANGNGISSLAPLARLQYLRHLSVNDNDIADLGPLAGHRRLEQLLARNNRIDDLAPLRSEQLKFVGVEGNPLDDDAVSRVDTLRESGATVLYGTSVPYFPAAGQSRQGFVRVINHSDQRGNVWIEGVDDAGRRFGPVRLSIAPRESRHFNSLHFERGNPTGGMSFGVGRPSAGDWRLVVTSSLDIEVLSYIRTADGFVTSMHDVAPDDVLYFFNPGANARQRSILRVVNTEAERAKWLTGGYDDRGSWRAMPNAVLVGAGETLTATAQALEEEHGLGDGVGKWRLRVRGWPWLAMSLLENPTGHLTNLSTAPDNVAHRQGGIATHVVPFFPAAERSRAGFVRVVNRSWEAGAIQISGIDDAGNAHGPMRVDLASRETIHFNSGHLENGNAAKGWAGGLGVGEGDWRLNIETALDVQVLAYVRTADGFVTAMHDLAPEAEDGGYRVVFFNPGSNTEQVSKLRLINNSDMPARVAITGIDDQGSSSGAVAIDLVGRGAVAFTAAQLEAGGEGISGRLGDGAGKWRLRVRSDEPLAVMSLLESPTGHLTNVSTGTRAGR